MKKSSRELLKEYGEQFKNLYLSGKTVEEIKILMNLTHHYGYLLKRLLGLDMERWQRIGMPEKFSEKTESLIYGTVMGDASVYRHGRYKYNIFSVSHSPKQLAYIEHKRNLLLELKPCPIKPCNDKWNTHRFYIPPHPQFDKIHSDFYSSGVKEINKKVLNKLTPEAIAWWFMDDGGIQSHHCGFNIATCCFNLDSIKNIQEYFKETYNIEMILYNSDYNRLSISGQSALKFKQLIESYIIPSMLYKINLSDGTGSGKSSAAWTKDDEDYLISNFNQNTYGERKRLAQILNRSPSAIQSKFWKLTHKS